MLNLTKHKTLEMISLSVTTETLLAEVFGRYSEERGRGSNIVSVEHWRAHRIHGTGIFTYIYHENQPNVDKDKYMDPMGVELLLVSLVSL